MYDYPNVLIFTFLAWHVLKNLEVPAWSFFCNAFFGSRQYCSLGYAPSCMHQMSPIDSVHLDYIDPCGYMYCTFLQVSTANHVLLLYRLFFPEVYSMQSLELVRKVMYPYYALPIRIYVKKYVMIHACSAGLWCKCELHWYADCKTLWPALT